MSEKIAGAPSQPPAATEPAAAPPAPDPAPTPTPTPLAASAPPAATAVQASLPLPAAPPAQERLQAPPDPVADARPDEASQLADQLRSELEAAQRSREALDAREARAAAKERVAYLRRMGAVDNLSDDNLLALAPAVDPTTQDGRDALQAWTDQNMGLFNQRTPTQVEVRQSVQGGLKSSTHGVFGEELHRRVIDSIFGGRER